MSIEIIEQRLLDYHCKTVLEQEQALKEIAQEIALMSLSRSGFFQVAAFQGGTCLRILYGLERFSEDLDFVLEKPDKKFNWHEYIKDMQQEFNVYGDSLEVTNRTQLNKIVQKSFIKGDSLGGFLTIKDPRTNRPKLNIKLEIDTNPPQGSEYELKYLDFPMTYSVRTQNLSSLFASKIHALLCRDFCKGRDWYDFNWYVTKKTDINFTLLAHALKQKGPWEKQDIQINLKWLRQQLTSVIGTIDWQKEKNDIKRFLRERELVALDVWSKDFFYSRVEKLQNYLDQRTVS